MDSIAVVSTKRALRSFVYVLLALCICSVAAYGAQDSTVIEDNAPVKSEPAESAKTIDYFPVGTEVRISSYPLPGGWYKVRARNGMYGWIHETHVSVDRDKPSQPRVEVIEGPSPERDRKWFAKFFGGYDFFRPEDLNDAFRFNDLNTGNTIGGELGYFVSDRMAAVFRVEALLKDIVARENTSNVTFNLGLRSYPIMGGFDFYFAKGPALRFSVGIFAGVASSTTFTAEALNLDPPNIVVLSSSPFTTYLRAAVTRPLGRVVSVGAELGYRYLKTDEISTANNANGGGVFVRENVYKAREIDLTGLVLAVGVGLHF